MMNHMDYEHLPEPPLSIETLNVGFSPGANSMLGSSREKETQTPNESKPSVSAPYTYMNFNPNITNSSFVSYPSSISATMVNNSSKSVLYSSYEMPSYYPLSVESTPTRPNAKTNKTDKSNKGLRHFSMKVLQKVQAKGKTTYNEVAEELVNEFGNKSNSPDKKTYEHKNIRRRVYDALNVLMAMKIIHKEKREIQWVGLPSNTVQECDSLRRRREEVTNNVMNKIEKIREMVTQQVAVLRLINKNNETEKDNSKNALSKINLPFSAITTASNTNVDCTVTPLKDDYFLAFSDEYSLFDETAIIKMLSDTFKFESGTSSAEELKEVRSFLPRSLHTLSEAIGIFSPNEFNNLMLSLGNIISSSPISNIEYQKAAFTELLAESVRIKQAQGSVVCGLIEDSSKSFRINGFDP